MPTKNDTIAEAKRFLTEAAEYFRIKGLPRSAEAALLVRDCMIIEPDPEPPSSDNTHLDDIVWRKTDALDD